MIRKDTENDEILPKRFGHFFYHPCMKLSTKNNLNI